jgi:type II secretory pathway pseudopilin PulG
MKRLFFVKSNAGYAYLDVLVATAVLMVSLLPALSALQQANNVQNEAAETLRLLQHVSSKMAQVQARGGFQLGLDIAGNTDLSDATGSSDRRTVHIAFFDGDNADGDNDIATGADDELILIRVSLEDGRHMQQTVVSTL